MCFEELINFTYWHFKSQQSTQKNVSSYSNSVTKETFVEERTGLAKTALPDKYFLIFSLSLTNQNKSQ